MKRLTLALILGFIIAVVCSMVGFAGECETVRESVLRLHVLANSDSDEDQALKLAVRDRVLTEAAGIFDGSVDKAGAQAKISENMQALQAAAEDEVRRQGYDYPVRIETANMYFSTRQYENITLPAGDYDAVRVLIGEAKGRNWWCVMFPPMCLPAAEDKNNQDLSDVLNEDELDIVEGGPKYEVKFKVVEWYESIKNWFQGK